MTEPSALQKLADDVVREMYSSLPTQWDRDCLRAKVLTALNATLRAAPAQGEPVAWRAKFKGHDSFILYYSNPLHIEAERQDLEYSQPLYASPVPPAREVLRHLVDIVWQHATESTAVPFTKTADMLIDRAASPSSPALDVGPLNSGGAGPAAMLADDGAGEAIAEDCAKIAEGHVGRAGKTDPEQDDLDQEAALMSDYSDSLRQQARWIDESREGKGPVYMRITLDDVDTDELRAAADEIASLRARLASARKALESPQMQSVAQQAIMKHPHYETTMGPMTAYGFAGVALKAVAAAISLTDEHGDK